MLPTQAPAVGPTRLDLPDLSEEGSYQEGSLDHREIEENGSGENVESLDKPEYARWTRVQHKHARSDGSLPNKTKSLTSEQRNIVDLAAGKLTREQQQKFQKHHTNVRPRRDSLLSSRGEGPSKPKGKGIDPREWRNVNISNESLDLGAQAAALNSFKNNSKGTKEYSKRKDDSQNKKT